MHLHGNAKVVVPNQDERRKSYGWHRARMNGNFFGFAVVIYVLLVIILAAGWF